VARKYTPGALGSWYRSKMQRVEEGVDDAMDDAGQKGEDMMKFYIMTRGTQKMWTHPWGPNNREGSIPGRVDTGKMLDAVGHRKTTQGNSRQLRVGWVSGTREDYFWMQDQGFKHPFAGSVEGMYALQDATDYAFEELKKGVKKEVKDA
jgi:hypothetical protein